jgi:hypothetical protein
MNIDRRIAEQPQRHRRALEMPPRAAAAEAEVPAHFFVRLRSLPQHEVARVVFIVVVCVDPRAGLQAVVVEPREAAVLRQR